MLTEITWPTTTYRTGTKHEPYEFYLEALTNSKRLDLLLGYFSSAAISVLSVGFAFFISNGGKVRLIINDVLSAQDKEAIEAGKKKVISPFLSFDNFEELKDALDEYGEHFFQCLSWLISNDRIEIKIIKPKDKKGISHYKSGVFSDGNNEIKFKASCNFTAFGLLDNLEELDVWRSWSDNLSNWAVTEQNEYFNMIFSEQAPFVEYLDVEAVRTAVKRDFGNKDIEELLINEKELQKNRKINRVKTEWITKLIDQKLIDLERVRKKPRFPFPDGPRRYQDQAYENWVEKGKKGLFAMATGTGKTITALNCLLNEFYETGFYRGLILVPTLALVDQWKKEVLEFNFIKIYEISGREDWKKSLATLKNDFLWDAAENYVIISTYASFQNKTFQKLANQLPEDTVLIADEAHNIGSAKTREAIMSIKFPKRIALSATPKRAFDPDGNEVIEKIFNDSPPYVYSYSMEKAIKNGILNRYFYYPVLVRLADNELEEYMSISKQLLKYIGDGDNFINNERVKTLLMIRKRIIHKAYEKKEAFRRIVKSLISSRPLKYCFIYVPEGFDDSDNRLPYYQVMMNILSEECSDIKLSSFLGNDHERDEKLKAFREGHIDVLVAMKCLDEGVDVPRAEVGIFAASTGNPRQFIQRRGRLLRTHPEKTFSYIYDLIVVPDIYSTLFEPSQYNVEKSLFKKELTRVAYFASLAENFYSAKAVFSELSSYYNLDIDSLIWELKDDA